MIVVENIRTFVNGVLKGTSEDEVRCTSFAEGYANAIVNHIKLMQDNTDCLYTDRHEREIFFVDSETGDEVMALVTLYTPRSLEEIYYNHTEHEPFVAAKVSNAGF